MASIAFVRRSQSVDYLVGAFGERVWWNADVRHYSVTWYDGDELYSMEFIVWLQGEFGMKPGVFSLDGQCWVGLDM